MFAKNTWYEWYNWLINYIPELIKKQWVVLKTKLWVSLKQAQAKIIVNQHLSKCAWLQKETMQTKNMKT